ncbi:MAG: hypothetical protein JO235_18110 [Chroococcidiopsidaceae cyanobacterium CP_BM_RX_35]|nr:hypothetical protein [Chroococcidiopsidaceae cyanobacterium CP_BM_RX_35]
MGLVNRIYWQDRNIRFYQVLTSAVEIITPRQTKTQGFAGGSSGDFLEQAQRWGGGEEVSSNLGKVEHEPHDLRVKD